MNMNMTHETSIFRVTHESDRPDPSLSDTSGVTSEGQHESKIPPFFWKKSFYCTWNERCMTLHMKSLKGILKVDIQCANTCQYNEMWFRWFRIHRSRIQNPMPHSSTDDEFLFKTKQVTIIIIIVIIVSTLWQSSIAMEAFEDVFHIKHGHIPLLC